MSAPRLEPVNLQLNAAVVTLANRLFPMGYDVAADAPSTLEALTHQFDTGRPVVWNGASDQTIFGSPETNWAFRAWHDWAHYRYQLPFNLEGERQAAYVQVAHLVRLYGDGEDVVDMAALILAGIIGQVEAFEETGQFPEDQRTLDVANAERFRPLAAALVRDFGHRSTSDRGAIRAAKRDAAPTAPRLGIAA